MKKDNAKKSPRGKEANRQSDRVTIGMDLGDKTSRYCVLDDEGEVMAERSRDREGAVVKYSAARHPSIT